MGQIVWKYTTVSRSGDEVITEVEGGRTDGGRLAFVRRRRMPASSSSSGVSVKMSAMGSSGRLSLGTADAGSSDE